MWPFQKRETRSGAGRSSYTDAVRQAILAQVGGATLSIPAASAAVEMACGVVVRAFQASELAGTTDTVEAALDAPCRGILARALMRNGEALFVIRTDGGRLRLIPGESSTVNGGPDPATWTYEITCGGPSNTYTYKGLSPREVIHVRYAVDAGRQWQGVGPLQSATLAGRLAGNIAGALADEAGTPRGYLLPVPNADGQDDSVDDLRQDLAKATGGLQLVESMAGDWREAPGGGKSTGWDAKRIGAAPPAQVIQLAEMACKEILAAYGLSPALFGASDGTASREAWRQALHGVIMPLARLAETELRAKLDSPDLTLSFDRLSASDISGRARAFQSLVGGGMEVDKAANLSGLLHTEE